MILKILRISESSNGRIVAKLQKFLSSKLVHRNVSDFTPTILMNLGFVTYASKLTFQADRNIRWKSQSRNKTEGKHDEKQNHICGILSMSIFSFSILPFSKI